MYILKSTQSYSNGGGIFSLQMKRLGMIYQDFTRDDFAFDPLSRIGINCLAMKSTIF